MPCGADLDVNGDSDINGELASDHTDTDSDAACKTQAQGYCNDYDIGFDIDSTFVEGSGIRRITNIFIMLSG